MTSKRSAQPRLLAANSYPYWWSIVMGVLVFTLMFCFGAAYELAAVGGYGVLQ
jgi:hypothetical protein